jgi:multidrug efflux pump subunit AcrA (membrane-fusion protein)
MAQLTSRLPGRKTLTGILVLAVLLAAGAIWWVRSRSSSAAASAVATSTVAASVQTLSLSVSATGTINPKVQSNLRFGSSGTVTAVDVKVGDTVTAGQQVAAINPTDLQTALDLAEANVSSAQANLTTVKASSTTTTSQLNAAKSQLAAAQAKLTTAQTNLGNAALTSPVTGTVATVNIAVGDQVSGGGTSSGGAGASGAGSSGASSAAIVVITTDAWVVSTSVTSADLPLLKQGMQAQITPSGSRTLVFGTVSTIGVIATSTSGVATFPVTIAVTGSPKGLYAGSSATVAIIVKEVADAVTVPTAAIRTEGGTTVVSKLVDGAAVTTPVQVGMVQGSYTQVTSGIAEGDQVVVTGASGAGSGSGGQSTSTRTRGSGAGGFGGGGFPAGGQGNLPAPPAGAVP